MQLSATRVLQGLLAPIKEEKKRRLLSFFSEKEKKDILSTSFPKEEIQFSFFSLEKKMEFVHFSWFLPTLKAYAQEDAKLFILALDDYRASQLAHTLDIELPSASITSSATNFLKELLFSSLMENTDLMPKEYLPDSPINSLAFLDKKKLIQCIDFLSLFDLSTEIKKVVDPKILRAISSFLTDKQKAFLKKISSKENVALSKIGLDRWNGDIEALTTLLHKKGIQRLGAALSNQDKDLIWYVAHHLDIGRGNALLKVCEKRVTANTSQAIMHSVLDTIEDL